jgi:hypothetical protein
MSTSWSKWLWEDSAPTFSSREDLGLRCGVLVLVLKLGFGVYISEIGFRCFMFWESGVDV